MRSLAGYLLALAIGVGLVPSVVSAQTYISKQHVVFIMTNDAERNQIVAYKSTSDGSFVEAGRFETGGRGTGGGVLPLESQGSLTLSQDHSFLFAVNAGSGELSVFRVQGASLFLVSKLPTGGAMPVSVAQRQNRVYVLNQGGSGAVVGFNMDPSGHLTRIPSSIALLSAKLVAGVDVSISPDGRFVVVVEQLTDPASATQKSNNIDTFRIRPDGTLGPIVENQSPGPGAFSSAFTPNGTLIVTEAGTLAQPTASGISSYNVQSDGTITPITQSVPTGGLLACWNVITPNAKFVYAVNAGTSNISGFAIARDGALAPIGSGVLASDPPNSANLDVAISSDGKLLFNINPGSGTIGVFGIEPDGRLSTQTPIPIGPDPIAFSGIAAL
jgi:6-phosphogluconolactonase